MSATTDEFAEELRQFLTDNRNVGSTLRVGSTPTRSGSVITVKVVPEGGLPAETRTITVS